MSILRVQKIRHTASNTDVIDIANDGSCRANIVNNLSNKNLILNGAFLIAQRGSSSTSSGYYTVDRFSQIHSDTDEAPTQSQVDVASGTTPYTLGFRKAFKITNGNQTSVGSDDYIWIQTKLESQALANCGWNYKSASSFLTLSFWVKSSVPQDFKGYLRSRDGTQMMYPFATGSLTADTWTKITKTIPGNSSLQFDNDVNEGLQLNIGCFWGTGLSSNSTSEDSWATWNSAARTPDLTSTWYEADNATFEITGVQLEVNSVATDFEHRSYGDELQRCYRYCQKIDTGNNTYRYVGQGNVDNDGDNNALLINFKLPFRDSPSAMTTTGSASDYAVRRDTTKTCTSVPTFYSASPYYCGVTFSSTSHGWSTGQAVFGFLKSSGSYLIFEAEL